MVSMSKHNSLRGQGYSAMLVQASRGRFLAQPLHGALMTAEAKALRDIVVADESQGYAGPGCRACFLSDTEPLLFDLMTCFALESGKRVHNL